MTAPRPTRSPPSSADVDGGPTPREIRFLGYRLHPLSGPEVIAEIDDAITERRRLVMANLNSHGMALMFENGPMARLMSQPDCRVMIDSTPLLFAANLAGHGLSREKRTTSLDFYDDMFALAVERGWKVGFVGSAAEVVDDGIAALRGRFPGLSIEGRHGYFPLGEDGPGSYQQDLRSWLCDRSHDLLIVGMGMPRQEEWIERIQHDVPTRVFLPTGAYLDYQAGAQKPPPRWIGGLGLEWLFRLVTSPRRLAYRYLVEPIILAYRLMRRPHPQRAFLPDDVR